MPNKLRQLPLDLFLHPYAQPSLELSRARYETLVAAHPIYVTKHYIPIVCAFKLKMAEFCILFKKEFFLFLLDYHNAIQLQYAVT